MTCLGMNLLGKGNIRYLAILGSVIVLLLAFGACNEDSTNNTQSSFDGSDSEDVFSAATGRRVGTDRDMDGAKGQKVLEEISDGPDKTSSLGEQEAGDLLKIPPTMNGRIHIMVELDAPPESSDLEGLAQDGLTFLEPHQDLPTPFGY